MPLVRFEVRNEYKLGAPELYKDAVEREDPKGVLDGVAVAGLVGILRQLGDLAEFAGEVFHGLQEQVISTASRSHKLMTRVERVEAALPSLEKAMLSQTSHIHFAYTPGSDWHARIRDEHNHFIYTELPRFIMDSYEECKEPPRLQLLDRFDSGGPGSCLKKYSDPSFFRRASGSVASSNTGKSRKDRKARKMKRRRSWQQSGPFSHDSSTHNASGRIQVSPPVGQSQPLSAQTTSDMAIKSEMKDRRDSRDGAGFIDCVFRPSTPMQADEAKPTESSSGLDEHMASTLRSDNLDEHTLVFDGGSPCHSGVEKIDPYSYAVRWDEKSEIVEPMELKTEVVEAPGMCESVEVTGVISETIEPPFELNENSDLCEQLKSDNIKTTERLYCRFKVEENLKPSVEWNQLYEVDNLKPPVGRKQFDEADNLKPPVGRNQLDEVENMKPRIGRNQLDEVHNLKPSVEGNQFDEVDSETDNFVDALNTIESESETDFDCRKKREVVLYSSSEAQFLGHEEQLVGAYDNSPPRLESPFESSSHQEKGSFHHLHDSSSGLSSQDMCLQHSQSSCNYMNGLLLHDSASPRHSVEEQYLQGDLSNLHDSNFLEVTRQGSTQHAQLTCLCSDGESSQNPDYSASPQYLVCEPSLRGEWYDLHGSTPFGLPTQEEFLQLATTTRAYPDELVSHGLANSVFPESLGHEQSLQSAQISSVSFSSPVIASSVTADATDDLGKQSEIGEWYNLCSSSSSGLPYQEESLQLATTSCAYSDQLVSHGPSDNSVFPDSSASGHEPSLQTTKVSSEPFSLPVIASFPEADNTDDLRTRSETDEFISSGAGISVVAPTAERFSGLPSEVEGVNVESSGVLPVAMWTNGGMLGLAPSKPPDLSSSSNLNDGSVGTSYKNRYQNPIYKGDEPGGELDSSVKLVQCDDTYRSEVDRNLNGNLCSAVGPSSQSSHSGLDTKPDESEDCHCKRSNCSEGHVLNGDCLAHSGTRLPVVADDAKTASPECDNGGAVKSSLLSGLSRGLLMDGFQKIHSSHDEKPQTGSPHITCKSRNGQDDVNYRASPVTDLSQHLNSPEMSPPPSPPLERMNISLQPFCGYQSSTLKLAYPDGMAHHEGALDSFPSFQLVPEPAILPHDVGSDSDDDTFCRSHVCLSDDCLSHLSDSNSVFWESGDSSETQDHALYDGSCRVSSDSISSSPKYEESTHLTSYANCKSDDRQTEFGIVQSQSGTSLDIPVLESLKSFSYQDTKTANHELLDSLKTLEPTPQPPPLPPWQWRESKSQLDSAEEKQNFVRGSLKQFADSELLGSSLPQPAKPVTEKPINTTERVISAAVAEKQHFDEPKSNGNNINQTEKRGEVDEKEDFLQQIRAKSFNLRRTDTTRPACKLGPATSFKVTAIIEKANAIRQAVASDDGEETDTWSDT